jgi:hypothetical protein
LFTGTVGQGSHFETLNPRIGTVWGPLGDPDSPFLSIPRLINAAAHGEAPDLVPPRPAGFADDGGDRCYVIHEGAGRVKADVMGPGWSFAPSLT